MTAASHFSMRPEFVYIRCRHCARIYRTPAGVCGDKLRVMMPILKVVSATCPYCETPAKVGESVIEWPLARA